MKFNDFNERKQHGIPDFPIQIYRVDPTYHRYVMRLHWHKELEIIRVLSGRLDLFINNRPFTLKAGDVAFVNCKFLHRAIPVNCHYDCIVCDLSMMVKSSNEVYSSYIAPIILSNLLIDSIFHPDDSPAYNSIIYLFDLLSQLSPFYELATMSALYAMFEQLYKANRLSPSDRSEKSVGRINRIAEMVKWIDCNYTEHITLDFLSRQSGLTPNYICKVFKEYTGKTPIEYLHSVRIENVCHDIRWGQKNITDAAIDNGYDDISYFCKMFRRHTGMSAKEYKRNCLNTASPLNPR